MNTINTKTPSQIIERLEEMSREILATISQTGDAEKDYQVDVLLGTLFACVDETINEIGMVCA